MNLNTIFLVEDDLNIRRLTGMHLQLAGYDVRELEDAGEARDALRKERPSLVLLDIMLPGEDGFSLGQDLIRTGIPVIFLTAKIAVPDRVRGLRLGAEDYILKPFEPEELLARLEVILRRTQPRIYADNGFVIDYDGRTVSLDGEAVMLTVTEYELLALLTRNAGAALSRERILSAVWGWDFVGETRTVDVHVQRLRAKLGAETIETVFRYGYRWVGRRHP